MKFEIKEKKVGYVEVDEETYKDTFGLGIICKVGDILYRELFISPWTINKAKNYITKEAWLNKNLGFRGTLPPFYNEEVVQLLVEAQFSEYFIVYVTQKL